MCPKACCSNTKDCRANSKADPSLPPPDTCQSLPPKTGRHSAGWQGESGTKAGGRRYRVKEEADQIQELFGTVTIAVLPYCTWKPDTGQFRFVAVISLAHIQVALFSCPIHLQVSSYAKLTSSSHSSHTGCGGHSTGCLCLLGLGC